MILSVIDRVVQSFSIGRLIIVSLVARILALFLLPPTPSFLAPDEGKYAYLAFWLAEFKNFNDFPEGEGLYSISKTLILPAAALVRLGLNELTAVRVTSIIFGIIGIYFFVRIVFLVLDIRHLKDLINPASQRLVLLTLILFAFMPSSLLWSTLGLRESASKAMILATVFFFIQLRETKFSKDKTLEYILAIFLPIFTLTLSFGARRQTAIIFALFFCLSISVMSRSRNFFRLTGVVILGTSLGLMYSTTPTSRDYVSFTLVLAEHGDRTAGNTKSHAPVSSEDSELAARCEKAGDRISTNSGEFICALIPIVKTQVTFLDSISQAPILTLDGLENRRDANRVGAQTALAATSCTNYSDLSIQNFLCNAKEFPYRLQSFLIRPLPVIDVGSLSNNLASVENVVWTLLLVCFFYSLVASMRKQIKLDIIIPTSLFVIVFTSLAALYEGNLGTAFRHKTAILWGLLLVIAIGMNSNWRKSEEERQ